MTGSFGIREGLASSESRFVKNSAGEIQPIRNTGGKSSVPIRKTNVDSGDAELDSVVLI